MDNEGSKELASSMKKLFLRIGKPRREDGDYAFEISPGCLFGALIEERLKNMQGNIHELRGRINGLIFLLVAVVFAEVITRLAG